MDCRSDKVGLACLFWVSFFSCITDASQPSLKLSTNNFSGHNLLTSHREFFQSLGDQSLIPSQASPHGQTVGKKLNIEQKAISFLPERVRRICLETTKCVLLTDASDSKRQFPVRKEVKNLRNKRFDLNKSNRTQRSQTQNSDHSLENPTWNYSMRLNFSGAGMTLPFFRIGPRFNSGRELPILHEPKLGLSIGSVHNQAFDSESSELSRNQQELDGRHARSRAHLHEAKTSISGEKDSRSDEINKFCKSVDALGQRPEGSSVISVWKLLCVRSRIADTFYGTNSDEKDKYKSVHNAKAEISQTSKLITGLKEANVMSEEEKRKRAAENFTKSIQRSTATFQTPNTDTKDHGTHYWDINIENSNAKTENELRYGVIQRYKRDEQSLSENERVHPNYEADDRNVEAKNKILQDISKLVTSARLTRDNISVKESDIAAIFRGVAYGTVTIASPLTSPELKLEASSIPPAAASRPHRRQHEAEAEAEPSLVSQVQEGEHSQVSVDEDATNEEGTDSYLLEREKDVAKFVIHLPDKSETHYGTYKDEERTQYRASEMSQFHESQNQNYFGFPTTIRLLIPPTPNADETTSFEIITQKSLLKPMPRSPWKNEELGAVVHFERQSFPATATSEASSFSTETTTTTDDSNMNGSVAAVQTGPTFAVQPEEIDYNPEKLFNNSDEYENQNSTLFFGIAIFNMSLLNDLFQLFCDNVEDVWRVYLYSVSGIFCLISSVCFWRLCCQCRALPFFLHVSFYLVVFASSFVRASIVIWNPFSSHRFGPVEILNVLSIAGEPSIGVVMSSFIALLLNVFYGMVILPFIIAFFSAAEMTSGLFLEFAFKYFRIHTGNLSQGNLNLLSFIVGMVWNAVIFLAYVLLLGCEKFRRSRRRSNYKSKVDSKYSWNYSVVTGGCHQISGCCLLVVLAHFSMVCLYVYILIHPKELLSRPKKLGYKWALFQITGRVLEIIVYTSLLISVGKISKSYLYHKDNFMEDSECCIVSCCKDRDFERKKKRKLGYSSDAYSLQRERENIVRHYPTDDFQLVWSRNSCIQSNQTETPHLDHHHGAANSVTPAARKPKSTQKTKKLRTVRERNEKLNNISNRKLCADERPPSRTVQDHILPQKRNHCEEYCLSKERVEVHRKNIAAPSGVGSQKFFRENYDKSPFQKYERKSSGNEKHEHRLQTNNVNKNRAVNHFKREKCEPENSDYFEQNSCTIFVDNNGNGHQEEFSKYSFLKTNEFYDSPHDASFSPKTTVGNESRVAEFSEDGKCLHDKPGENGAEKPEVVQENSPKCKETSEINCSPKRIADLKTDLQKILDVCLPPPDKSMYKYMGVTLPQAAENKSPCGSDPLQNAGTSTDKVQLLLSPDKERSVPRSPEELSSAASHANDEEIIVPSPKKFWSPPPNRRTKTFKNLPPMPLRGREPIHLDCLSPLKPNPPSPSNCTQADPHDSPTQPTPTPGAGDWRNDFYSGEFTVSGCPTFMPRGDSVGDFWGCRTSPLRDRMLSADLATVSSFSEMRVDYLTDLSSGDGYSLGSISFHRASRLSFSNISDCLNYY